MDKDLTSSQSSNNHSFFRNVVKNGNSVSINLTEVLKDFDTVRVTIIKKTKNTVTLKLEDTRAL